MAEVASRVCQISGDGGQAPSPLVIVFGAPVKISEDEYKATASIDCRYFQKRVSGVGLDGLQALLLLPLVVHGFLIAQESQGYSIFWLEPGDLHDPGFWGAARLTFEEPDDSGCVQGTT